jgi:hypothetical protein
MIVIQSSKTLKDTYTGKTTAIDYIPLTNSGTKSVDAYVHVDYDNVPETYGISMSTTYSGVYIGIEDSVFLSRGSQYNIGIDASFDNTEIDTRGRLIVSDFNLNSGTYVSQVIPVSNMELIGGFISDYDIPSGTNIALYYRCSNKKPIPREEIWWRAAEKVSLDTFELTTFTSWGITPYATCFEPNNGRIVVSLDDYLKSYDFNTGSLLYTSTSNDKYEFDHRMRIDRYGYIWGYNGTSLLRLTSNFEIVMEVEWPVDDTVHDYAPTTSISGSFWYTDTISNRAVCADENGDTLFSVFLYEPRAICSTNDGGCWVIDNKFKKAFRYSKTFVLVKELELPYKAYTATEDGNNGFWYSSNNRVIHLDGQGKELVNTYANDIDRIVVGRKKTMLYSNKGEFVLIIKNSTGEVLSNLKYIDKTYKNIPAFLTFGFEDRLDRDYLSFPLSYDPVWGPRSNLSWQSITNGTTVDKGKYYQFKVLLSTVSGTLEDNPSLARIGLTSGIKVSNILPGETRNIYIKNEPLDTLIETDYNFNLNCTWKSING